MIAASELRNWVLEDPLLDWLERYGEEAGFVKDTDLPGYVPQADLGVFTRAKGREFESRVFDLLQERIAFTSIQGAAANEDSAYEATLAAVSAGQPAIWQGLVRDRAHGLFGVPDLIVRGDVLESVVPGSLGDLDAGHYYVLDIKYKGLDLNKNGDLAASHKWDKVQISIYEHALAEMLQREPAPAFLLGRSLSGSAGKRLGCFSRLGWAKPNDPRVLEQIERGIDWLIELEEHGRSWQVSPPSDARLRPNSKNNEDSPWHEAKKSIMDQLSQPSEAAVLMLPERFEANREEWFEPAHFEFFVDFETFNSMNDDFSKLPLPNGKEMIFMIGCGHEEEGEFRFEVWTAENESVEAEAKIIRAWLEHMGKVRMRLAPGAQPRLYHWYRHEPQEVAKAAERSNEEPWSTLPWYDLMDKVFKAQPVTIAGVSGFSIKPIARALSKGGAIDTVWGDSAVGDGIAAMAAAWWCYKEAAARGNSPNESALDDGRPLMAEIEEYNLVDCKVMWELLRYVRAHH